MFEDSETRAKAVLGHAHLPVCACGVDRSDVGEAQTELRDTYTGCYSRFCEVFAQRRANETWRTPRMHICA